MSYIILFDLRENNGQVLFMKDDNDNVIQYEEYEEAEEMAKKHHLSDYFPVKIIDLDE